MDLKQPKRKAKYRREGALMHRFGGEVIMACLAAPHTALRSFAGPRAACDLGWHLE